MRHTGVLRCASCLFAMCLAVLAFADSVLAASPKEKVIYSFRGVPDAALPEAGLIFDAAGNLYGTSDSGGAAACGTGCGTIFELRPESHGNWREQVLYRFTGSDGLAPDYGLVFDTAGNLYSTTSVAGCCGEAFEIQHTSGGWQLDVIHGFGGRDGSQPHAGMVFDNKGNLSAGTRRSLPMTRSCFPPVTISPAKRINGRFELLTRTRRLTSAPSGLMRGAR